ncbi:protein-tyrosine phosphatase [Shimia gijangensis]|uniref:protein-tyrosine-phosphatase n=1 Tax=Shimia gijangensis TaxID=1470563 RepID=A0A1M6TML0_9RHOB|nr:phosphotyrosine protein phosphatase [Shimia gijangensis]SHK58187.1 protein-tyrosine phosphatase [Shimia gijangensis]
MIESVLVVCVGNVCRSPVGERLLQSKAPNVTVSSAGVGALVNKPADATASRVAAEKGVSLEGHKGRQATAEILSAADLILVMETGHKAAISQIAPQVSGRVMLVDHWTGGKNIADPYKRSQEFHEQVFRQLDTAMNGWSQRLAAK